jgi:hypothetical protein
LAQGSKVVGPLIVPTSQSSIPWWVTESLIRYRHIHLPESLTDDLSTIRNVQRTLEGRSPQEK